MRGLGYNEKKDNILGITMSFLAKISPLVLFYLLIFAPAFWGDASGHSRQEAVFVAVFLTIFLAVLFSGFFLYKIILEGLGVRVLSAGGDIIKTDFGSRFSSRILRAVANIAADTVFNLVFVLFLIFFAVISASFANDVTGAFDTRL